MSELIDKLTKYREKRIYMGPKNALIPRGSEVILINRIGKSGVFIYNNKLYIAPIRILHKLKSSHFSEKRNDKENQVLS